jgi:hypothetical protein
MIMVTAAPHTAQEVQYANEVGVATDAVFQVNPLDVRVRAVPTILVVISNGRIVFARENIPTSQDEADIGRILDGL